MMMGPGPAVNQLPTPRATLKVSNIPSFVTGDDFSRLMLQLEGCVDARLLGRQPGGDQVGYGEFSDKMNASKAKNLYHGWTGWGGRGLAIELTDFPVGQLAQTGGPGQKRMREGDDLLQPGNNYKQARPDMPAMGGGMAGGMGSGQPGMQQPAPQQDVSGLLQNLSSVTSLLQQQGIAQQLLAAAQQQVGAGAGMAQPPQQAPSMLGQGGQQQLGAGGMMGGGAMVQASGGGYVGEAYNPAAVGPGNSLPQQPQQQMGGMMGGGGGGMMAPQQQQLQHYPEPAMQQGGGGYMGASVGGPQMQQQQQQPMMQGAPQQQYGMGPQAQPQMMQPSMGPGGGMMQPQQPQMMPQQPSQQGMMQPGPQQGMGPGPGPGMHRGDVMAPPPVRQYPHDACNTLYIEGLPADVTRRELAHIFRGTEGFRSLRLVIKDSKKHAGEKLVMAFAEYTNTYFATEAMDKLQGYPFDLDDPETMNFFIKYARPMTGGRPGGPPPPLHRGPPGGRGGPDVGGPRGPPPLMGSRGGGMMMEGRGRGGRGGGRFGPGGPPPRESPRRGY